MQIFSLIYNQCLRKNKDGITAAIVFFVVIIIIGVLASVGLPNLLVCGGKGGETEGRNYIGTMNRAQQAYHFEKNTFASNTKDLGISWENEDEYYDYSQEITPNVAYAFAIPKEAENDVVRNYTGATFFITDTEDTEEYLSGICLSNEVGGEAFKPKLENGVVVCHESMTLLY